MPSAVVCAIASCTVALVMFVDVILAATSSAVACAIVLPPLHTFSMMSSGRYSPARCARRGNTIRKSMADGTIEAFEAVEVSMIEVAKQAGVLSRVRCDPIQ